MTYNTADIIANLDFNALRQFMHKFRYPTYEPRYPTYYDLKCVFFGSIFYAIHEYLASIDIMPFVYDNRHEYVYESIMTVLEDLKIISKTDDIYTDINKNEMMFSIN